MSEADQLRDQLAQLLREREHAWPRRWGPLDKRITETRMALAEIETKERS